MKSLSFAARLLGSTCALLSAAHAEPNQELEHQAGPVTVEADRERETSFSPTESITTVGKDRLEREQPATVFDAVRDIPGVSVNGGPRATGMKFNIRGYSDSEDVTVKVDGVTKGFEKYRFGGTFIEPELLKQIQVERGPSIASGSGALGGTVTTTTKSAADFLRPGQQLGARMKAGYATNNYETLWSGTVYGRPTQALDLLANVTDRDAGEVTLPNGSKLKDSQEHSRSELGKISLLARNDLSLSASYVGFETSGLEPFDATAGQPGIFGTVVRSVRDKTWSLNGDYLPGNAWVNLHGTLGYSNSHVHDLNKPGQSIFANAITGNVNDDYFYDIYSLDLANTAKIPHTGDHLQILTGVQYLDNTREVTRVAQNPAVNNALYPGGFNPAQPPGNKRSLGVYAQPIVELGALTLKPGIRWDQYTTTAAGGTLGILDRYGEASSITISRFTPSFGASYQLVPKRVTLFGNYVEGFRPPLLDEYFTQGAFGRCIPLYLKTSAPRSGICGSLYVPETSKSWEGGVSLAAAPLWRDIGEAALKVTVFRNIARNTLDSIQQVAPGVVAQPGVEDRHGVEIEASFDLQYAFARAGYAVIQGQVNDGKQIIGLFDVPGDTFSMTLGVRPTVGLELGVSVLDVTARDAVISLTPTNRPVIARQAGYHLLGAFIHWQAGKYLELAITGENLENEAYFLNDGFGGGIGSQAPGRTVRFTGALQF